MAVVAGAGAHPSSEVKNHEKRKPGLEHFSHLPFEQLIGFGRGFC
ncbi:hypothetical protein ABIA48_000077 [Pseudomonas sp. S30_BP2TU TE3576]|jgi:hypothetical protein